MKPPLGAVFYWEEDIMAPTMTLQEKREKREVLFAKAMEIVEKIEAEDREPTQEERDALTPMRKEMEALAAEIAEADKKATSDRETLAAIRKLGAGIQKANDRELDRVADRLVKGKSVGQRFLESAQYRAFMSQFPGGHIPDYVRGIQMSPVMFATLLTGESSTSAGAMVVNDRQDMIVPAVRSMPAFIDLVTIGSTESDTVEFVRVTAETNAADTVPEATATNDSNADAPESGMTFEVASESVKGIKHWIPATKRSLSDVGQLRTLIDGFLRFGLRQKLNNKMITGPGGTDITGIDNTSGIQSLAYTTDVLTTMRKARTKARVTGGVIPTAYLMHPNDWETIDLLKDKEDRFYFGGPMAMGAKTVWGLPVAEDEGVNEGHAFVSDWRMCVLWLREQATISISDSHSDFFIRGLVAILGEERAAFGCLRPVSIVKMSLNANS